MANLEDLKYTSILDMSHDEAIDTLRQIRLSRRTPKKKSTTSNSTKLKAAEKRVINNIDANLAAELLKILGG